MKRYWKICFAFLFLIICYLWGWRFDWRVMGDDPNWSYMPQIESEEVHRWHSVLFIYEMIALKKLISLVTHCTAEMAMRVAWCVCGGGILLCLCVYNWRLIRRNKVYVLSPILMGVGFYFLHVFRYSIFYYYIDYFFTFWLMLSVILLVGMGDRMSRVWRVLRIGALIVALVHLVMYRSNAWFLLPILSCWFVWSIAPGMKRLGKLGLACVICGSVLGVVKALDSTLPAKECNPMGVLLASELRNAAVLMGQVEEEEQFLKSVGLAYNKIGERHLKLRGDYWMEYLHGQTDPLPEGAWDSLKKHYGEAWLCQPHAMLAARLILTSQFFTNGKVPPCIRENMHQRFPALSQAQVDVWEFVPHFFPDTGKERVPLYVAGVVAWALLVVCRKRSSANPELRKEVSSALWLGGAACAYTLSFLVFIPTPDNRYHSPTFYLLFVILAIMIPTFILCVKTMRD